MTSASAFFIEAAANTVVVAGASCACLCPWLGAGRPARMTARAKADSEKARLSMAVLRGRKPYFKDRWCRNRRSDRGRCAPSAPDWAQTSNPKAGRQSARRQSAPEREVLWRGRGQSPVPHHAKSDQAIEV